MDELVAKWKRERYYLDWHDSLAPGCKSCKTVAPGCESCKTTAPGCKSYKSVAPRCEGCKVAAPRCKSCKTAAPRGESLFIVTNIYIFCPWGQRNPTSVVQFRAIVLLFLPFLLPLYFSYYLFYYFLYLLLYSPPSHVQRLVVARVRKVPLEVYLNFQSVQILH